MIRHAAPGNTMLRVGGLTPLSTTDWPGMLSAVVFCQGCPWRCGYCHNPDLIPSRGEHEIPWEDVLAFLRRRQGLLDGVVFSGGEPTLQAGLIDAMREVRALGFKIGLHTGGMLAQRLDEVLPLVDWVGMDVKAPFAEYPRITGAAGSGERALAGLQHVLASGVDHEIRTTVHPALLTDAELVHIGNDLAERGVRRYVIQVFRRQGCTDAFLRQHTLRDRPLKDVGDELTGLFEDFSVRT
jgi:pyruvate formate lyase activating enzyme